MLTNNRDDNDLSIRYMIINLNGYQTQKRHFHELNAFLSRGIIISTNVDSQANLNITHEDSIALKLGG